MILGYLYATKYDPDMGVANGLVLRVFLPALVFDVVSSGDFAVWTYRWLILAGVIVVLGSGLIAWPIGKIMKFPNQAFVPSMMFNNCGNLGLPLMVLAFGEPALEAAIVLFLISNMGHFTIGVYLFGGAVSWKGVLGHSVNIATVLALGFNFTDTKLPEVLQLPITMLGQIVIPLMLFSLGVRMQRTQLAHWRIGLVSGIVCPLSGILFALLGAWILPLSDFQIAILILFAALPPAVLNFLFSEQYNQQPEVVASIVLIGNAMSVAILSIVLWWLL